MSAPIKDDHDPFNTRRPEVYELTGLQKLVFYPLAWGLRSWYASWRIRMDAESQALLKETTSPRMVVTWHNRSLVMGEVCRRVLKAERFTCLVSASRMAAWEVAFFRMIGFGIIRGSTTRRSIQASREMFKALQSGNDIGISPDGPSGPLYTFQSGAIALARKAAVPMLMIVPNCSHAYRMKSWDRHMIPPPFARIDLRIRLIPREHPAFSLDNEAASAEFRRVCLEITEDPFNAPPHD